MAWSPVGYVVLGPTTKEVRVGRLAGVLLDGTLHLRVGYGGSGSPDAFSFFIVDFKDDNGIRSVGSAKWWPRPEPSAVRLGPSPEIEIEGSVLIRARSFNSRRLLEGYPSPVAPVFVEAWLPSGQGFPEFTPRGFAIGSDVFNLTGGPVGPAGAYSIGLPSNA
jgi:hypothetical protein